MHDTNQPDAEGDPTFAAGQGCVQRTKSGFSALEPLPLACASAPVSPTLSTWHSSPDGCCFCLCQGSRDCHLFHTRMREAVIDGLSKVPRARHSRILLLHTGMLQGQLGSTVSTLSWDYLAVDALGGLIDG